MRFRAKRQEQYQLLRGQPAVTTDGQHVKLLMNAGLLVDLPHLTESGAEGIGLFRTELQFMVAETMPRMEEQKALYGEVITVGRRPAGDLPHARHRRRQGAALHDGEQRGEPGDGLAGDPHRPRPAGAA